ncbi:hypothetical protein [Hymenobacter sp. BT559]|uniref:hypothetical protein n=1 Tax=Hymenobacter sp. BT559 TaxID=2795729 RepID=UPI0018EBFAC8|nr:hypothetical protein [Hymenobacter sp. BT559]MBJ6144258.1 hypothetical protein [Hymenobacter sp. BT559]
MKNTTLLLGLALLGACSSNNKEVKTTDGATVVTFNDFEAGGGWLPDPTLLAKGQAHSGQYAMIVNKDHEFSLTFNSTLGRLSPRKFKKLRLEAWAYMPDANATGNLGIQLMDASDQKQLYGDGISFRTTIKEYGEWVPISKEFVLPDTITANQHLRMFLWRADAQSDVLVDDVKLSIVE